MQDSLVISQNGIKNELIKSQAAAEQRTKKSLSKMKNAAEKSLLEMKNVITAANKETKDEIKNMISLHNWKLMALLFSVVLFDMTCFEALGVNVQYAWRRNVIPTSPNL